MFDDDIITDIHRAFAIKSEKDREAWDAFWGMDYFAFDIPLMLSALITEAKKYGRL